mgnify:FL=1
MARTSGKGYGRNNVVATGSDSGDQVSVNAWNDDKDAGGMLGFTSSTKTISSGAITPIDTATVAAAEAGTTDNLDFITYSDTMENDILYLFADAGDTITVRHNQSPGAGQSAIITTSAASVTLSETVPLVLQRRSTTFYQIIENSISSVTAGSTTTFTNKSIDLTDNTLTGTSAELATAISDETGSGALVFGTSPTLVTPALGTPSALVLTNATGTLTSPTLVTPALGTPASGTLTSCTGLPIGGLSTSGTASSSTYLRGDGAWTAVTTYSAPTIGSTSIASGATVTTIAGLTLTSPTLTTPALGTPASGVLTNATGLPPTGVVGTAAILGANTFTATQTSPSLDVEHTTSNAEIIRFRNQSLDGQFIAKDTYKNLSSTSVERIIAQNIIQTTDYTNGAEDGSQRMYVMENGTLTEYLNIQGAGAKIIAYKPLDMSGTDIDNIQNLVHDLTSSPTVSGAQTLDFNADQLESWALSGSTAITFNTSSNKAVGRSKTIRLVNDATLQNLTLNASWKVVGTAPTDIAASKTAILTLTCFGTAETDIVAAYAVEA